jgi:hypothetical protein
MSTFRFLWAAILLSVPLWGQAPADVTVTLAAKDGRTQFRLGEAVKMELRFQSSAPGKYLVSTWPPERTTRFANHDRVFVEPEYGAVDPLSDMYETRTGEALRGNDPVASLGATPVVMGLFLNDWISFRRPGRYQITADTMRVYGWGANGPPAWSIEQLPLRSWPTKQVPLRSNALTIDLVAPEAGWAEDRLKEAVAVLEGPDSPDGTSAENAARVLRFLETPEAAHAMVRLSVKPDSPEQAQLDAGFWGSPYRNEIITDMEQAIAAADFPVRDYFIVQLEYLRAAVKLGPAPPEGRLAYLQQARSVFSEGESMLRQAIPNKRGEALTVSRETLGWLERGPHF